MMHPFKAFLWMIVLAAVLVVVPAVLSGLYMWPVIFVGMGLAFGAFVCFMIMPEIKRDAYD
jgi:hypothetical protein